MKIIKGGTHSDKRGSVVFFNSFNIPIQRFYEVSHTSSIPRAFHGHFLEEKYVRVVKGTILLCIVKITGNNIKNNIVKKYILSDNESRILKIPAGYANGFKPITKNTKVLFFSPTTLKDSLKDDHRFPYDYWGKEVWKI